MTVTTTGGRTVRTMPIGYANAAGTVHALTVCIEDDHPALNSAVRATLMAVGGLWDAATFAPNGGGPFTCYDVAAVTRVDPARAQQHLAALHTAGYLEQRLLPLGHPQASQIAYTLPRSVRIPADRKD